MDRFQQAEPEQRMLMVSGPWTSVGYSNVSVSKWPLKAGAFVNLTFARLEYFIYAIPLNFAILSVGFLLIE